MKASVKDYNQSPRKTRLVADAVRGKQVPEALTELSMIPKRATGAIRRLLASAAANAKENNNIEKENLYVKEIRVDDGRVLKRARPAWKGMAHRIRRRRSHIAITLGERERVAKVSKKKVEKEGIDTKNETSDNKEKIKK